MMTSDWAHFLDTQGAHFSQPDPSRAIAPFITHFGENQALPPPSQALMPLTQLGLIAFTGEDAANFLHNQLTNDVRLLNDSTAQYSALCTPQGRMISNFILYAHENTYLALLSKTLIDKMLKRLQMFVLRSKVKLIDHRPHYEIIGLSAENSEALNALLEAAQLPVPTATLQTAHYAAGSIVRVAPHYLLITVAANEAPSLWETLSKQAHPTGSMAWESLNIDSGTPWISDATTETVIPQMANFDKIGVNFQKGCYPGQEIVARAHYLGKVKRHLYRVHALGELHSGEALFAEGSEEACGLIINAAPVASGGMHALAVIKDESSKAPLFVGTNTGIPLNAVEAV